jgi:hypothetical protein
MKKSTTLGVAAAAGAMIAAPAGAAPGSALAASSYADLLSPIPNASELLRLDDAARGEPVLIPAQYYHHHYHRHYHHHHHHHHVYRRVYHHHHHVYRGRTRGGPGAYGGRNDHHHHPMGRTHSGHGGMGGPGRGERG